MKRKTENGVMPEISSKGAEAGQETWSRFSLAAFGRNQPHRYLDLGLLDPKLMPFSWFVILCYSSTNDVIHILSPWNLSSGCYVY